MSISANPTPEVTFEAYRVQWDYSLKTWLSDLSKVPHERLTGIPDPSSSDVVGRQFADSVRSYVEAGWRAEFQSRLRVIITSLGLNRLKHINPGTINFQLKFTNQPAQADKNSKSTGDWPPGTKIGLHLDITAITKGKIVSESCIYRTSVWTRLPTNRMEDVIASVRGKISIDLTGKTGRDSILAGFDKFKSGDEWQWPAVGTALKNRGFTTQVDYAIKTAGDTGYTITMIADGWAWTLPSPKDFQYRKCYTGTSAELLDSFEVKGILHFQPSSKSPGQSVNASREHEENLITFPESSGHDEEDLISF